MIRCKVSGALSCFLIAYIFKEKHKVKRYIHSLNLLVFTESSHVPYQILLPNRLYTEYCLFFAMSRVTELFHRSINMTIDWHYTTGLVSRFPVKNTKALIIMRGDDARTVRL